MEKVDYINTKREDLPKWLLQLWRINPELAEKAEIDYISLKKQLSIQGVVGRSEQFKCRNVSCDRMVDRNSGTVFCKKHKRKLGI
ncbi:hypothetical protein [Winogradskyella forsetii]|uniref:hypothetical protein n=1 Tax=Winogradskyella forsetii TaxID=2686077 RepID=UPI0015BD819E|nr:hypothetical protein [Winogradskyella forsetii]